MIVPDFTLGMYAKFVLSGFLVLLVSSITDVGCTLYSQFPPPPSASFHEFFFHHYCSPFKEHHRAKSNQRQGERKENYLNSACLTGFE